MVKRKFLPLFAQLESRLQEARRNGPVEYRASVLRTNGLHQIHDPASHVFVFNLRE